MRDTTVVVGQRILRIEPNRLTEVSDGAVVLTPGVVGEAAGIVVNLTFRTDFDRLSVIRDGLRVVALGWSLSRSRALDRSNTSRRRNCAFGRSGALRRSRALNRN